MSQNGPREIKPVSPGLFGQITLQVKLIIRLMGDSRVSPFLKVIPVLSLLYWLVPDLLPGPIDDAGLMFLGGYLFVELCPRAVVNEHLKELTGKVDDHDETPQRDDVIDGEFHDVS